MVATSRPIALVIEDMPQHAHFARQQLQNVGFDVVVVHTLVDATREAHQMHNVLAQPVPGCYAYGVRAFVVIRKVSDLGPLCIGGFKV